MKNLTAYLELDEINGLFKQIDALQAQVLLKTRLISSSGHASSADEPVEISREATAKSATVVIQKILDLVRVAELKMLQLPEKAVVEHFLPETLELYQGKIKHLRRKLKDSQLAAYNEENATMHVQRLREYCPEKTDHDTDLERSVDARQALFAGRSTKHEDGKDKNKSMGEQILAQNKNITSSLQHSKQLMTMSVMQTELNIDTLDQQSKDLTQLNEKLIDMEAVLGKSKQIVKFIERQDKHDKRRIYLAIGFLLLCSAWVLWRRVLKMPVKLFLWSLFKMFGVFNWATTVTTRGISSAELSLDILTATATHLESALSKTETIDVPQKGWETMGLYSSLVSSSETLIIETEVSSTEPSTTEAIKDTHPKIDIEEPSDFTDTFRQDITNELPVLTWEGSLPDMTEATAPSYVWNEEETIPFVGVDEPPEDEYFKLSYEKTDSSADISFDEKISEAQVGHENPDVISDLDSLNEAKVTGADRWENQDKKFVSSSQIELEIYRTYVLVSEVYNLALPVYKDHIRADEQAGTKIDSRSETAFESEPTKHTELVLEPNHDFDSVDESKKEFQEQQIPNEIDNVISNEVSNDKSNEIPNKILNENSNEPILNGETSNEIHKEIPSDNLHKEVLQEIRIEIPNELTHNEGVQNEVKKALVQNQDIHYEVQHDPAQSTELNEEEYPLPKHDEQQGSTNKGEESYRFQAQSLKEGNLPKQESEQPLKEINIEERDTAWEDVSTLEPAQNDWNIHDEL